MPDLAMCRNKSCPRFHDCYRAQVRPAEFRQSYMGFKWGPRPDGSVGCDDFIPMGEKK